MGKLRASNVSEPTFNGKWHVLDADASPLQCKSRPMAPVIVTSKVAPVTTSERSPVPVSLLVFPSVMEAGAKPVILALVLESPQSFQASDNCLAALPSASLCVMVSLGFGPGLASFFISISGALSISMQKSAAPLFAVAFATVFVVARVAGNKLDKLRSTLTGTLPAAIGKFRASKVSEPTFNGKWHVLDADASPLQCKSCPMAPVIVTSKVAPVTTSESSPVPVSLLVFPSVMEAGVKPVILALVLESPQSFQANDNCLAALPSALLCAVLSLGFGPGSASFFTSISGALSISMQKSDAPLAAVAFATVLVVARVAGNKLDKLRSTLTGTLPAAIGKFRASKVSEPTFNGKWHVLDADASPLQCKSCPMAPVIVTSKVAPVTTSERSPVPVSLF